MHAVDLFKANGMCVKEPITFDNRKIKEIFLGIIRIQVSFSPNIKRGYNATITKVKGMENYLHYRNIENPYLHLMPLSF